MGIDESVPQPQDMCASAQERAGRALTYMAVAAGPPRGGRPIERVFLGSCANAPLPDLRLAAPVV
jgi:3-isopropylmalate/(R)-2-methylmalate dehydratase large subunit